MQIKTYWDLSEKERSRLSPDEIEEAIKVVYMVEGIQALPQPDYEPVPEPISGETIFAYVPKHSPHATRFSEEIFDVAFRTEEQAKAFLALEPMVISKEYPDYALAIKANHAISYSDEKILTSSASTEMKQRAEKIKSVTELNEKRRTEYQKNSEHAVGVSSSIWTDYSSRCEERRRLEQIMKKYREYIDLSKGDASTAMAYLVKGFGQSSVDMAFDWTDTPFPISDL